MPVEILLKAGLKINQTISQEEIEKLIKENEYQKVYDQALKFLSYRPRSEKEMFDWFKRKEVGTEVQKLVLVKLKERNFIDDEEFARWWIEQRLNFRPLGLRLLARELQLKGIGREIIEKQTASLNESVNEEQMARKLIEKKIKAWAGLLPKERQQKLIGFLGRRGFSWEIIRQLIDEFPEKG